ncbi:MAG: hypothetical protein HRK26_00280 [Rickettsiaceae bacterium H1]|nr:hypothetical protein [Rickettsiaceae bacterium H1]
MQAEKKGFFSRIFSTKPPFTAEDVDKVINNGNLKEFKNTLNSKRKREAITSKHINNVIRNQDVGPAMFQALLTHQKGKLLLKEDEAAKHITEVIKLGNQGTKLFKEILRHKRSSSLVTEENINQIIEENNQQMFDAVMKKPDLIGPENIKKAIEVGNNKILQSLLENKTTKQKFNKGHVDQIIKGQKVKMLSTVLDHKISRSHISSNHVSELIADINNPMQSQEMLKLMLREGKLDKNVFVADHIKEALEKGRTDIVKPLLSRNKHNTDKLIDAKHVRLAIEKYVPGKNETLPVVLEKKTKLFKDKTGENKEDAIDFAIEKNNYAFKFILEKNPELVTEKHLTTAISLSNVEAVNMILEQKPELLTKTHVTKAAETGKVAVTDAVFTKAFAKNEDGKKAYGDINQSKVRNKALFELAQHTSNSADKIDTGLFKTMSNLMAAGANSKIKFTANNGIKTTAEKIMTGQSIITNKSNPSNLYKEDANYKELIDNIKKQKSPSKLSLGLGKKTKKTGYKPILSDQKRRSVSSESSAVTSINSQASLRSSISMDDSINEVSASEETLSRNEQQSESYYETIPADQENGKQETISSIPTPPPIPDSWPMTDTENNKTKSSQNEQQSENYYETVPAEREPIYQNISQADSAYSRKSTMTNNNKNPNSTNLTNDNTGIIMSTPARQTIPADENGIPTPPPIPDSWSNLNSEAIKSVKDAVKAGLELEIREGTNLKKVPENEKQDKSSTITSKSKLLLEIRKGIHLKKVPENEKQDKSSTKSDSNINNSIFEQVNLRRSSIDREDDQYEMARTELKKVVPEFDQLERSDNPKIQQLVQNALEKQCELDWETTEENQQQLTELVSQLNKYGNELDNQVDSAYNSLESTPANSMENLSKSSGKFTELITTQREQGQTTLGKA